MAKTITMNMTGAAEIAGFIKCQLLTGHYTVGQKLPTADELARRFKVDPNTARAAYARLKSEGLVESTRGKGTFVKADIHSGQASRVSELVRSAISEAQSLGLSAEELATVIWLQKRMATERSRVWYVDNNFPYFEAIRSAIGDLVDGDATGCSLARLKELVEKGEGPRKTDLVITSKFNLEKVGALCGDADAMIVPIVPQMSQSTIEQLSGLPSINVLGVVCVDQIFAEISGKVIERGGISGPQLRGNSSDVATLPSIFSDADAIAISTVALGRLKAAHINLPDKAIVPFHYAMTGDCEAAIESAFRDLSLAHA